jgi:4-hydroxybenzoate polyprenyltransferase
MISQILRTVHGIILGFRPLNLFLIASVHKLTQRIFVPNKEVFDKDSAYYFDLNNTLNALLWASVLIAAAGYLVNDYTDKETDRINSPKKPSNLLIGHPLIFWSIWIGLNFWACVLGFSIDFETQDTHFGFVFLGIIAVLWGYNQSKWGKFIIGPIMISVLVALNSVLVMDLSLDFYVRVSQSPQSTYIRNEMFTQEVIWIWRIAILAFLTNLIREFVKDIEDINGDKNAGRNTLAVVLGVTRTAKLSFGLSLILIIFLAGFVALAWPINPVFGFHLTVILILSALVSYKSIGIENPSQAKSLSLYLKLILALGLLCLFWL